MDYIEYTKVFKAFCDEQRLQILSMLHRHERCACDLLDELTISQPTLSHHMKILCESGIVVSKKKGKMMHYAINKQAGLYTQKMISDLIL